MKYASGTKGSLELLKRINLEYVLKTILEHRPISRAQISTLTGLNKMTVSSCVEYFLEKGVIQELGTASTSRGRPPTLTDIHSNAGIIIGIDIEITHYIVLISDLAGNKLEARSFPIVQKEPLPFIQELSGLILSIKDRYADRPLSIAGIGIAIQGYYHFQSDVVIYLANWKSWNEFHLKKALTERLPNTPIWINPSPYAGAMGEIHFGRRNMRQHLVYVGGSWGLSAGIYQNHQLLVGSQGTAGRLGHSTIHMNGKKCTCGNRGCWEAYGSIKALYEMLNTDPAQTPFAEISNRMKQNDATIMGAVHQLGHYHGIGLANVINAYNPDDICIGGYLALLGTPFLNAIWHTLQDAIPERFLRNLNIYCSDFGDLGVAYGAISMVMDQFPAIFIHHETEENGDSAKH